MNLMKKIVQRPTPLSAVFSYLPFHAAFRTSILDRSVRLDISLDDIFYPQPEEASLEGLPSS